MLLAALYAALAGAYLLVFPFIFILYVQGRWHSSSGWEKLLIFFGVFFFFPGIILLGPFVNYRPQRRTL